MIPPWLNRLNLRLQNLGNVVQALDVLAETPQVVPQTHGTGLVLADRHADLVVVEVLPGRPLRAGRAVNADEPVAQLVLVVAAPAAEFVLAVGGAGVRLAGLDVRGVVLRALRHVALPRGVRAEADQLSRAPEFADAREVRAWREYLWVDWVGYWIYWVN